MHNLFVYTFIVCVTQSVFRVSVRDETILLLSCNRYSREVQCCYGIAESCSSANLSSHAWSYLCWPYGLRWWIPKNLWKSLWWYVSYIFQPNFISSSNYFKILFYAKFFKSKTVVNNVLGNTYLRSFSHQLVLNSQCLFSL